ncbi:MAG TPA: peptidyl-prolyl cis-trans isomerase [Myxococcales bacterium]|nr:peptidyl-prolyl cis-trans isomerase [Myxococcales bacterium]
MTLDANTNQDERNPIPSGAERRALWLLGLGAAAGLFMATYGIVDPSGGPNPGIPPDAVATVNGEVLRRDAFERLLAGFASDSRNPIDDDVRRHVLNRMIEEELLVQRALGLGLAEVDRRVRANLTSSLIDSVVSGAEEREPSPEELRRFYSEEAAFFVQPGRYRVDQILFRIPYGDEGNSALQRAEEASAALKAGESFAQVAVRLGDDQISPLPDTLLPAMKLREYVGPTALEAVLELEAGEFSPPVRSGTGVHLLRLLDIKQAFSPPFEEIETQIRREYIRRAGDRALRNYLDQLREDSDVVIALPARQ